MKRIFPIIVTVLLLFTMFAFPVSAAGDDAGITDSRYEMVELVNSDFYTVRCLDGGSIWENNKYRLPTLYSVGSPWVQFRWNVSVFDIGFETLYLSLSTEGSVSGVYLTTDIEQGKTITGYQISKVDNIHQYKFEVGKSTLSNIQIQVSFAGTPNANTRILSLVGTKNNAIQLTTSSYSIQQLVFKGDGIGYFTTDYASNVSYPIVYNESSQYIRTNAQVCEAFLYISWEQRKSRISDQLVVFVSCLDDTADFSVSLVDTGNANKLITTLPFTYYLNNSRKTYGNYTGSYEEEYNWPVKQFALVIDTGSYDIAHYSIQICSRVGKFHSAPDESAFLVSYDSAFIVPSIAELPWYRVYFGWNEKLLTGFKDSMLSGLSDLSEAMASFSQSMNQDSSGLDNFQQNMQQSNQELTDISDAMASVDRPDVSNVDFDFSKFLAPNGAITATSIMSAVMGPGQMIGTILLIVFSLALVAYVFFGKR